MPDLRPTAGASDANSFVSDDEFLAYLDERMNTSALQDDSRADDRARALISATRELNLLPYVGTRVLIPQTLAWPRQYAINPDLPNLSIIPDIALLYFDATIVPDRIKRATMELALMILQSTSDLIALDPTTNIQSKTTDVLTTTFVTPSSRAQGLARFPHVLAEIAPLLDPRSAGLRLSRQ